MGKHKRMQAIFMAFFLLFSLFTPIAPAMAEEGTAPEAISALNAENVDDNGGDPDSEEIESGDTTEQFTEPEEDSNNDESTSNKDGESDEKESPEGDESNNEKEKDESDEVKDPNKDNGESGNEDDPASDPANEEGTEDSLKEEEGDQIPNIGLTSNSEESYEDEIGLTNDHIKDFSFKVNGNDFVEGQTNVRNGDSFELKLDFIDKIEHDDNNMNFGPGTVLKYQLPDNFTQHFTGLSVPENFGTPPNYIGQLQINATEGFVTITLNDNIKEGVTIKDIEQG